jgi:hypothetical protein
MDAAIANHIIQASETIGLDLELREDYSGRSMYGSTTHAITGDESDFMKAVAYAAGTIDCQDGDEDAHFDLDDFVDAMGSVRTDSMGRSCLIWY